MNEEQSRRKDGDGRQAPLNHRYLYGSKQKKDENMAHQYCSALFVCVRVCVVAGKLPDPLWPKFSLSINNFTQRFIGRAGQSGLHKNVCDCIFVSLVD